MVIQSKEITIARRPTQTKTIVGTLPRLPISPLQNGYMCARTQKLKKTPPKNLLHCGISLYTVLENPTTMATMLTVIMANGGRKRLVHLISYKSAKMSSSSSPPDFDVRVNDISIPATTFNRPYKFYNVKKNSKSPMI